MIIQLTKKFPIFHGTGRLHWTQLWHKIYLYNFTFFLLYKKYFSIISPSAPRSFQPFLHYRFSD
jgi:hypothetical protein